MHGGLRRPPCITFHHYPSQRERIDDERHLFLFSSSILIISSCLLLQSAFGTQKIDVRPLTSGRPVVNLIFSSHNYLEFKYIPGKILFFPAGFPASTTSSCPLTRAFHSNPPGGRGEIDDGTSAKSVSSSISSAFPKAA